MSEERDAILSNGWEQGKFIRKDSLDFENVNFTLSFETEEAIGVIIISQTCDIAQHDFSKEPLIECLAVFSVENIDALKANGRNARNYHFKFNDSNFQCDIWNIGYIEKEIAVKTNISEEADLSEDLIKGIAQWRARRYTRTAWPDKFNERTETFFKGRPWKRFVERFSNEIHGIFMALDPSTETEDEYKVAFKVVIYNEGELTDLEKELSDRVEVVLEKIEEIDGIKCLNLDEEYIEKESTVVPRSEFSALDMKSFLRWIDGDYHSANPENDQEIISEE